MESDIGINTQLALNWLTQSGIQDKNGGFYAWYRLDSKEYSFLYPEITGYAIQLLCKLHAQGYSVCLPNAVKAGDWLVANQNKDGSFFCKQFSKTVNSQKDESFYTFDAGIISLGLLSLYRHTTNRKYLEAALKTLTLLLNYQKTDGSFNAGRSPNGRIINNEHWSQTSSCHHLKLVIPLLQAYNVTYDDRYFRASKSLLGWGLNLQLNDGRFIQYNNSKQTYTHAHCYAAEGLLGFSSFCDGIDDYLSKRIQSAMNWLLDSQNSDGSFYNWNDSHIERMKVTESVSQALRLFLLASNQGICNKFEVEQNIEQGFLFLKKMQLLSDDIRVNGGVMYVESNGKKPVDVCTCSTIFALHATMLKKKRQSPTVLDEII